MITMVRWRKRISLFIVVAVCALAALIFGLLQLIEFFDSQPLSSLAMSSYNPTVPIAHAIATTGCHQPTPLKTGGDTLIHLTSGRLPRSYVVYLPDNYSNVSTHALVLNFHGYNGDAQIEQAMSRFNAVAAAHNFIVVYPNGSYGKHGKRGWNTGLHPTVRANDFLFVSNLLNQLQHNLCIQPTQIYATGLSNGGGFTNYLACNMADRIAAFAPVSGSYVTPFHDCHPARPVPIIEFHGTADPLVPYNGQPKRHEPPVMTWLAFWANKDGCQPSPQQTALSSQIIRFQWTGCRGGATIVHYRLIGGIHRWPAILFPTGNQPPSRTQPLDAANVIWQFFKQHPLPVKYLSFVHQT